MARPFTFIIVGDVHGRQIDMYRRVLAYPRPIDFILQVGDFEAHRDADDVASATGPKKYRTLGQFPQLLPSGWVPVPTLFIGGNHEAFRWLAEYEEGGELLPGLDYLGRSGVRGVGPLQVAGLSGIFSPDYFNRPRHCARDGQHAPDRGRALTYFRYHEIEHLVQRWGPCPDILLLHDWPAGLLPAWASRGNVPARKLVETLRPRWVFCGHHHFSAMGMVPHANGTVSHVVGLGVFGGKTTDMVVMEATDSGIQWVEALKNDAMEEA